MTKPPIIFRLMLSTLFLPIVLAIAVIWLAMYFHMPEEASIPNTFILCLSVSLLVLPFALWLWILCSGNWRRPILTAGIVYFSVACLGAAGLLSEYVPPDKRMIRLGDESQKGLGIDMYCNGVHLGQLPLKIRVDELIAKVPEWDTPPEQRWYDDSEPNAMLLTWVPWDGFIKERYEASRKLPEILRNQSMMPRAIKARQEALNQHYAGCRYWWSLKCGDAQLIRSRDTGSLYRLYGDRPFDQQWEYRPYLGESFSLSAGFHAQLLADVLPELTPEQKADWDHYVLTNWTLLGHALPNALNRTAKRYERHKEDPLYILYNTALHSTARLKYGLSDPPTEEESRRYLAKWVEKAKDGIDFYFTNMYVRTDNFLPDVPIVSFASALFPADILGTMRKPLTEQWRKDTFRFEYGWAPVAYYSGQDQSPDYFAEFARYVATTHNAQWELLNNKAPQTAALFRTLLYHRRMGEVMTKKTFLYLNKIDLFGIVGFHNPLLEAEMREYIEKALTDPDHTDATRRKVEIAVTNAIWFQAENLRRGDRAIDKGDFAAWAASLPGITPSQNLALRMLRLSQEDGLTFADRLQQVVRNRAAIETDLTLDDLKNWLAENPERNLAGFIHDHEEQITLIANVVSNVTEYDLDRFEYKRTEITEELWRELPKFFFIALLRSDTAEGDPQIRDLIRQIWQRSPFVLNALESEYLSANFRRGGEYTGSNNIPEYILDLILEEPNKMIPVGMIPVGENDMPLFGVLSLCDSPKAGEILEQWRGDPVFDGNRHIVRSLETWQTRRAVRQRMMEVFHDLLAGRIGPDDLLLPQPAWVWKEGQYVQEN